MSSCKSLTTIVDKATQLCAPHEDNRSCIFGTSYTPEDVVPHSGDHKQRVQWILSGKIPQPPTCDWNYSDTCEFNDVPLEDWCAKKNEHECNVSGLCSWT